MNKKISQIVAGISVLGCLGAFLPNQVLGEKDDPCTIFNQTTDCTKNQACRWTEFRCSGPKKISSEAPLKYICEQEGGTWNKDPHCRAKAMCHMFNHEYCEQFSGCHWKDDGCHHKPLEISKTNTR